jgi:flagellar motor protein MotB
MQPDNSRALPAPAAADEGKKRKAAAAANEAAAKRQAKEKQQQQAKQEQQQKQQQQQQQKQQQKEQQAKQQQQQKEQQQKQQQAAKTPEAKTPNGERLAGLLRMASLSGAGPHWLLFIGTLFRARVSAAVSSPSLPGSHLHAMASRPLAEQHVAVSEHIPAGRNGGRDIEAKHIDQSSRQPPTLLPLPSALPLCCPARCCRCRSCS